MGVEWDQIRLGKNDRGTIIGATGSGKTVLAEYLINDPDKPYSVTYDAKVSDSIGKWRGQAFIEDFGQLVEADPRERPRIIYRPDYREAVDPVWQDRFFEWVYNRWFTRLFVDEAYAITGGSNPSFHFQACLTRGRERGVSTLVATQRPARIPLVTLSEAEHFYIFRLTMPQDRKRVSELTGGAVSELDQIELDRFEFLYFNVFSGKYPKKLKLNLV